MILYLISCYIVLSEIYCISVFNRDYKENVESVKKEYGIEKLPPNSKLYSYIITFIISPFLFPFVVYSEYHKNDEI